MAHPPPASQEPPRDLFAKDKTSSTAGTSSRTYHINPVFSLNLSGQSSRIHSVETVAAPALVATPTISSVTAPTTPRSLPDVSSGSEDHHKGLPKSRHSSRRKTPRLGRAERALIEENNSLRQQNQLLLLSRSSSVAFPASTDSHEPEREHESEQQLQQPPLQQPQSHHPEHNKQNVPPATDESIGAYITQLFRDQHYGELNRINIELQLSMTAATTSRTPNNADLDHHDLERVLQEVRIWNAALHRALLDIPDTFDAAEMGLASELCLRLQIKTPAAITDPELHRRIEEYLQGK